MELLESRMPSATWGSSKQAACGGDRFHGMEWRERDGAWPQVLRPGAAICGSAWKSMDVDGAIPWG